MTLLVAALAVSIAIVLAALVLEQLERNAERDDGQDVDERLSSVRRLRRDDWGFRWVD